MVLWQSTTCWCYCRLLGNRSSVIQLFFGIFRFFHAKMFEKRAFLDKQCFLKILPKQKALLLQGFLFARILKER